MRTRVCLVGFLLLAIGSLLAANQFGVADSRNVTFYQPFKVAGTLLPAGEYKILHTMEGENHIMLFRQTDAKSGKAGLATAKCTLKPLPEPAKQTMIRFSDEAGVKVLTLMQFKGDSAQHTF